MKHIANVVLLAVIAASVSPVAARDPGPQHHHGMIVAQPNTRLGGLTVDRRRLPQPIIKKALPGKPTYGPSHSDTRAIIFVGGHAALNPQPIPPGHSPLRPISPTGSPH